MIAVTISPDVTPEVYVVMAQCIGRAVEAAESGAKAMNALGEEEREGDYAEAAALLAAVRRQFERKGTP